MESLYVLIPLTLLLLVVAVAAFFWAVGSGQFEDLDSPSYRILLDDHPRRDNDRAERAPAPDDETPAERGHGRDEAEP